MVHTLMPKPSDTERFVNKLLERVPQSRTERARRVTSSASPPDLTRTTTLAPPWARRAIFPEFGHASGSPGRADFSPARLWRRRPAPYSPVPAIGAELIRGVESVRDASGYVSRRGDVRALRSHARSAVNRVRCRTLARRTTTWLPPSEPATGPARDHGPHPQLLSERLCVSSRSIWNGRT